MLILCNTVWVQSISGRQNTLIQAHKLHTQGELHNYNLVYRANKILLSSVS